MGYPSEVAYRDQASALRARVKSLESQLNEVESRLPNVDASESLVPVEKKAAEIAGKTFGSLHKLRDATSDPRITSLGIETLFKLADHDAIEAEPVIRTVPHHAVRIGSAQVGDASTLLQEVGVLVGELDQLVGQTSPRAHHGSNESKGEQSTKPTSPESPNSERDLPFLTGSGPEPEPSCDADVERIRADLQEAKALLRHFEPFAGSGGSDVRPWWKKALGYLRTLFS